MFKILFMTDAHVKGVNPKTRKDFFPDTIIGKCREIAQIAVDEQVDVIVDGGDLTDSGNCSPSVFSAALAPFVGLAKWEEHGHGPSIKVPIPFIEVMGNHSVFGNNPDSYVDTNFIVAETSGSMTILKQGEQLDFYGYEGIHVQIMGSPSTPFTDVLDNISEYMPVFTPGVDFPVNVVHGFLTDIAWGSKIPHTRIDDILQTEALITLTGHEHLGFGMIKRNGRYFINPGAVSRIRADFAEIARMPRVTILTLTKDADGNKLVDVKFIYLKCAKPGEDILSREAIEAELVRQQQEEMYAEKAVALVASTSFSLENIITEVAASVGLSDGARAKGLVYLEDAEKELARLGMI